MRVEFLHQFAHHLIGDTVDIKAVHIRVLHEVEQSVHFCLLDMPTAVLIHDALRIRFLANEHADGDP